MTIKNLSWSHWQIVWEVATYSVSGFLLIVNITEPSFKHVAYFLSAEYLISIVNTVGWWRWLNNVDRRNRE